MCTFIIINIGSTSKVDSSPSMCLDWYVPMSSEKIKAKFKPLLILLLMIFAVYAARPNKNCWTRAWTQCGKILFCLLSNQTPNKSVWRVYMTNFKGARGFDH